MNIFSPEEKQGFDSESGHIEEVSPQAFEIAGHGDYDKITAELEKKKLLEKETERVKNIYSEELESADFLSDKGWEMLTVMELFDPITAEHCISTYQTAKEKVEKPMGKYKITLSNEFRKEQVSVEQFYNACLFHDIGKIAVPRFIIDSHIQDEEWREMLCKMIIEKRNANVARKINLGPSREYSKKEILEHLDEQNISAPTIVPVKEEFGEEQMEELKRRGLSPEDPLGEIVKIHEEESAKILSNAGFEVEAELVGEHHNYFHKILDHPITIGALQVSADTADLRHLSSLNIDVTEILHIIDVEQALRDSGRKYKKVFSKLAVLDTLIMHASKNLIGKGITYLWVEDEFSQLVNEGGLENLNEEEDKRRANIEKFLEKEDENFMRLLSIQTEKAA